MPVEISDWNDLDNVQNDLSGDYVLVNDLDSGTDGYAGIGDDWDGDTLRDFTGTFNGDGFEIRDLDITAIGSGFDGEGLFANIDDADSVIENLHVDGVIEGPDMIGLLCGRIDSGEIKNCSVSGEVIKTGADVGQIGCIGRNGATIQNCVSHVDVTALDDENVGGLVGFNNDTVTDSYATGSVEGDEQVGGLVGFNNDTVTDSYATGSAEGDDRVGGLVGENSGTIETSYAVALVSSDGDLGGLCADPLDGGTVTDSYWDTEASGQDTSDGGTGLTTAEMQGSEAETNMDGFDFSAVWDSVLESDDDTTADGYPILLSVNRVNQLESQGILALEITGQITLDETGVDTADVIVFNLTNNEFVGKTETDAEGNYTLRAGATGDTIAIAVDFDDGTERYGRVVTTVLE